MSSRALPTIHLGTLCSGTDFVIKVFQVLFLGASRFLGAPEMQVSHTFSCERDKAKQRWIRQQCDPPLLFADASEMRQPMAFDVISGRPQPVPPVHVLVAGFDCRSVSRMNNNRRDYLQCISEKTGSTGATFDAVLSYVARHRPRALVLENVPQLRTASASMETAAAQPSAKRLLPSSRSSAAGELLERFPRTAEQAPLRSGQALQCSCSVPAGPMFPRAAVRQFGCSSSR